MKQAVVNLENKHIGEVELSDTVFGARVNVPLLYENVKMQLASRRSGTAATKNTALVSGTTAKMYRQKGTGRARHGSFKMNIFVGGGTTFGPMPRDYCYSIPKKAKRAGLKSALSMKRAAGKLLIVSAFALPTIKTKAMVEVLQKLEVREGLIVIEGENEVLSKSVRNIPGMKLMLARGLNVADVMRYEHLILTQAALTLIEERFST